MVAFEYYCKDFEFEISLLSKSVDISDSILIKLFCSVLRPERIREEVQYHEYQSWQLAADYARQLFRDLESLIDCIIGRIWYAFAGICS